MNLVRTLFFGGPVAFAHVARQARIARRMAQVRQSIDRENELHRAYITSLKTELGVLALEQHNAEVRAAAFWKALS